MEVNITNSGLKMPPSPKSKNYETISEEFLKTIFGTQMYNIPGIRTFNLNKTSLIRETGVSSDSL